MFQSYVKLTNARNVQLHVSYNGMGNSEAEIEIEKAFNSTVHLSFQVRRQAACLAKPLLFSRIPGTPPWRWPWMTPPSRVFTSLRTFLRTVPWRWALSSQLTSVIVTQYWRHKSPRSQWRTQWTTKFIWASLCPCPVLSPGSWQGTSVRHTLNILLILTKNV